MRVVALTFQRVESEEFDRLLSQLRHLGYQTVSSRAFRAWQRGEGTLPERAVLLTFDGGYDSHFTLAAPLLVRHRFTGTFCVAVDQIGRPGQMTWEQVRKLVFLGMEIGSHGLSPGALTSSKQLLEERLGVSVRALTVPEGRWNGGVAEAARRAGYDAVWASTIGTNGRETNPLGLRRVLVRRGFSVERIVAMVEGWAPAFWWAGNLQQVIRLLKRTLGVYRYEQLKQLVVPNA